MEQQVTDEAVAAAVKAWDQHWGDRYGDEALEEMGEEVRVALEAAAPFIAAQVRVTNEEELDALPNWSVVLSESYTHHESGERISFQRWDDGLWHRGARSSFTDPDNFLPVTVLHIPEATK